MTSVANCGACGESCSLPGAEASCVGGKCLPVGCNTGYADCDGKPENGCEASLDDEFENCGACDQRCSNLNGTPSCEDGTCAIQCSGEWRDCNESLSDGCETTIAEDARNCGACERACAEGPGRTAYCVRGKCGSTACEAGKGDCNGDGVCTDALASDINNCGYCGHRCFVQNGTAECVNGECRLKSCLDGYENCDSSADDGGFATGCEVNTDVSLSNCGGCGQQCSVGQGVARCVDGDCRVGMCSAGYADCDADRKSCETDTRNDPMNCGGCSRLGGLNCVSLFAANHAAGSCVNGSCVFDECLDGYADCDSNDVCEADLKSDVKNCGGCGVTCKKGAGTLSNPCVDAACKPECAKDHEDCNEDPSDGCEASLRDDPEHCGGCEPCSRDGTRRVSCDNGTCVPLCDDQHESCDDDPRNGCESNIASDPDNCGACGVRCELPSGTDKNTCVDGRCVPQCKPERGNCDDDPRNGCEMRVVDDDKNCGACDRVCLSGDATHASSNHCVGTACVPTCEPGYGACSTPELGCTTALTSPEHCGACTNACGGVTTSCVEARCQSPIKLLKETFGTIAGSSLNFATPELVAGENRLLLLAITGRSVKPGSFEQAQPEAVRVGGVELTPFADFDGGQGPSNSRGQNHYFFYSVLEGQLRSLNSGEGISVVATSNGGAPLLAAHAMLFSGVDQAEPIGLKQPKRQEVRCEQTQPTDTLALKRGGSVIYSMIAAQETGTEFGVEPPLAWKLRASIPPEQVGNREVAILGGLAGIEEVLASGSTTLRWTFGSCSNWTLLSAVIQPVQAAPAKP